MYKYVQFPLVKDDCLIIYPDDVNLFANVIIDGDIVHAVYSGEKEFAESAKFREDFTARAVSAIKIEAFRQIELINGEQGWRSQRASDAAAMGDNSELQYLIAKRKAVRDWSNAEETALAGMAIDALAQYVPEYVADAVG